MKRLILLAALTLVLPACKKDAKDVKTVSGLHTKDFVKTVDGKETALYILRNTAGLEACITNYGGRVVSLLVPDRDKNLHDVVLGYDNIDAYLASDGNYGALIGRFGNRIKDGVFSLDDVVYELPRNNNGHCLHGGLEGYHTKVWDAEQTDAQTLTLKYLSADGEAGFPGNLDMTVTYTLTDDNALNIKYEATTDKPTVVNLTNHSYFNLGKPGSQVLDHYIYINADTFTAVDETLIPYSLMPVDGTPMDLRRPVLVSVGIDSEFDQIRKGKGFDHNWVLNTAGDMSKLAAKIYHDGTGIVMDVYTDQPGVQFYSGNAMERSDRGKNGVEYPHRGAICLETQHYPDSPNQPGYPSTTLRPGEKYKAECKYQFKTVPNRINDANALPAR